MKVNVPVLLLSIAVSFSLFVVFVLGFKVEVTYNKKSWTWETPTLSERLEKWIDSAKSNT